jgi:hypothetical protein
MVVPPCRFDRAFDIHPGLGIASAMATKARREDQSIVKNAGEIGIKSK